MSLLRRKLAAVLLAGKLRVGPKGPRLMYCFVCGYLRGFRLDGERWACMTCGAHAR